MRYVTYICAGNILCETCYKSFEDGKDKINVEYLLKSQSYDFLYFVLNI